jgi:hypothetical protein
MQSLGVEIQKLPVTALHDELNLDAATSLGQPTASQSQA